MNEIEVPLKITGIGAIKKELRDIKGALAEATDPKEMERLAQAAGQLKDQLADANEKVAVFASGSKFEQTSNAFGLMQSQLMSLDFDGAAESAKLFTGALKSINPAEFATQAKGLISVFMSMGSAIGVLTKQFISFGVSLLANPLFLLVAVITAIVAAILIFLNKIGVLKKVLDTLMGPINALIQGFKDLTDWLGLTSFAAEENAEKMKAANEKVMESSKDRQEAIVSNYDYEIRMAKIYGQDTLDLELNKSKAIGTEAKTRLASLEKALKAQLELGSKADKAEIKRLRGSIKEQKAIIDSERKNRNAMKAEEYVQNREDAKKEAEQSKKEAEERARRAAEEARKAAEAARKFAADRLAAQRTIKDIELSLIENDSERERKITQEKYARLIEDTQKNESLTAAEKTRLTELYNQQLAVDLKKQEQIVIDAEKEKQKKLLNEYNAGLIKQAEEQDKQWLKLQELTTSRTEFEKTQLQVKYDQEIAAAEGNAELQKALTTKLQQDLNAIDKKAAEDSVKITQEAEKKKRDAQLETANNALQIAESGTKAIQAVGDIAFQAKMAKVKKGSKEEEELAKKQFKFNKSLQLAGAVVDAGKAITASLAAAPLAVGVVPNPVGIANLVATAAISAANIAKIASTQFTSTGGGGGQPSVPQASSTSTTGQATPNTNLFGQGNDLNNVSAPQETQTQITVKAVVSETEITNTQQKIDKINQNATL
jgi:hypothetical protein